MKNIFLSMFAFLYSAQTLAHCEGDKYPNISVAQEIKKAEFVVFGKVIARQIVVDPIVDPEGYTAEIFQVEVQKIFSGNPKDYVTKEYLTIYNYNASSRFLMEKDKVYLLFVSEGADGYWINSCGHSGELAESQEVLMQLRKLTTK